MIKTFDDKTSDESHLSLRDNYEVTGYDCLGSRMTGGGFGGCTISLVESVYTEQFTQQVKEEYYKKTGYVAESYLAEISEGLTITQL